MKHHQIYRLRQIFAILTMFWLGLSLASAARVPENRKTATHVLTGKIERIDRGGDRRITIRLKIAASVGQAL